MVIPVAIEMPARDFTAIFIQIKNYSKSLSPHMRDNLISKLRKRGRRFLGHSKFIGMLIQVGPGGMGPGQNDVAIEEIKLMNGTVFIPNIDSCSNLLPEGSLGILERILYCLDDKVAFKELSKIPHLSGNALKYLKEISSTIKGG